MIHISHQGTKGDKGDTGTIIEELSKMDVGQQAQSQRPAAGLMDVLAQNNSGVTYTRWGRNVCPNGAEIVYKGDRKKLTVLFESLFIYFLFIYCP